MLSKFDYHGRFQFWSFFAGHGLLLLRSPKSKARFTQVDILFKNVAALQIPTIFDDIHIQAMLPDQLQPAPQLGFLELSDRTIFGVSGQGFSGYVIAGTIVVDEADREYDAISPLLQS